MFQWSYLAVITRHWKLSTRFNRRTVNVDLLTYQIIEAFPRLDPTRFLKCKVEGSYSYFPSLRSQPTDSEGLVNLIVWGLATCLNS